MTNIRCLRYALVLATLAGCSNDPTAGGDMVASGDPPGKADGVSTIEGEAARLLYDALGVEGVHDGGYRTTKSHAGQLRCVIRAPFGAPASTMCDMDDVLSVEDWAAEVLFEAMADEAEHDGGYHTTKEEQGTLSCTALTPWEGRPSYSCTYEPASAADPEPGGAGIEGDAAEAIYEALDVEGEHDGGYHTTKKHEGELRCVMRTPWGGASSTMCDMDSVLSLDGIGADALFEAMTVQGEHDGGYHTTKVQSGALSCTVRTPWGAPASYSCSFGRQGGGGPVGEIWNVDYADILTMLGTDIEGETFRELAERYDFRVTEFAHTGPDRTRVGGYAVEGTDASGEPFYFNYRLKADQRQLCRIDWFTGQDAQEGVVDETFGISQNDLPFGLVIGANTNDWVAAITGAGLRDLGYDDRNGNHRFEIPNGFQGANYVSIHPNGAPPYPSDGLPAFQLGFLAENVDYCNGW